MKAVKGGTGYRQPKIERAEISHFKIYEVSDMELDDLKEGDDGGKKFNCSVSCFSSLIGMVLSFATSSFHNDKIAGAMYMLAFGLFVLGIICYVSYRKSEKKTDKIYDKIKSRG